MEGDKTPSTIIQRKKKNLKISKDEILLMLRCYQSHPTSWDHIIDEMKENLDHLPGPVRELYTTSAGKQIRDRLCNKFGKLMRESHIEDDDIRREIEAITRLERHLVHTTLSQTPLSSVSGSDIREVALESFSDSDEGTMAARGRQTETQAQSTVRAVPLTSAGQELEHDNYVPAANPARKASKKRSLMDLVRKNQLHNSRFITKKVPKLLR